MKKIIPIILCLLALTSTVFIVLYKKEEKLKQEKKDKINDINK